jgi:hypothetical protein
MIGREWVVMLETRTSSSIHYGPENYVQWLAQGAKSTPGTKVIDGPRVRSEWEAMTLQDKVARGLKID